METLALLAGIVIGAATAWYLGLERAAEEMRRLRSELEGQISYWQDRYGQAAAWLAGCQQGRADMLSLTRALASPTVPSDDRT